MKNLILRRPPSSERNYFRAAHAYQSDDPGDLSFECGDVVIVTKEGEADDWWFGKIGSDGKVGVFPGNYVVKLDQPDNELPVEDMAEREEKLRALKERRAERRVVVKGLSDENDTLKDKLLEMEAQRKAALAKEKELEATHRAELTVAAQERAKEADRLTGRVAELEDELVDAVASRDEEGESDDDTFGGLMAHLVEKKGDSERARLEERMAELEEQLVDAVVGAEEAETLAAENEMLKRRLSQLDDGVVAPWVVPDIETEQRLEVENSELRERIEALAAELARQSAVATEAEEAEADAGLMSHLTEKRAMRMSTENESLRSKIGTLEGELDVTVDLETVEMLTRENERLTHALEQATAALAAQKAAPPAELAAPPPDPMLAEIIAENRALIEHVAQLKREVKAAGVSPAPTPDDELECLTPTAAGGMLEAVARFAEEQGSSIEDCARGFMKLIDGNTDLEAAVRRLQKVTPLYEPAEIVAGM